MATMTDTAARTAHLLAPHEERGGRVQRPRLRGGRHGPPRRHDRVHSRQRSADLWKHRPHRGDAAHVEDFPDMHVYTPYPTQFGSGDWITVITRATGTFRGQMVRPDGKVIAPTGKAFDVEFGQTTKWDGDRIIIISAFWDTALQAKQLGLAG